MKTSIGILLTAILCVVSAPAYGQTPAPLEYVCPPCASDCHDLVFDEPGTCPVCNMVLVDKRRVDSGDLRMQKVAILVFDGVQIIDYTGPYEVFGQAGFDVATVSKTGKTITTAMGMSVNPRYSIGDCPAVDLVVVPGGSVDESQNDLEVKEWIRKQSLGAKYVLSVCNGAFILAATGLLDSLSATTFYGLIDELRKAAPSVDVVEDQRFVDNGKYITSAGLSSGIDASLHVVSKIFGKGRAQQVALNMEYDWKPESTYARAALADRHLRAIDTPAGHEWRLLSTEGDRDRWEKQFMVRTDVSAEAMLEAIDNQLATQGRWSKSDVEKTKGILQSLWRFADEDQGTWKGQASVAHLGSDTHTYLVTLAVERDGKRQ